MSTNGTIIYEDPNGIIEYRTNFYDSHVYSLGYFLHSEFSDEKQIQKLFALNQNIEHMNDTVKSFNRMKQKMTPIEIIRTLNPNENTFTEFGNRIIKTHNKKIKNQTIENINNISKYSNEYTYFYNQSNKHWLVSKNQEEFIPLHLIAPFSNNSKNFFNTFSEYVKTEKPTLIKKLEKLANEYFINVQLLFSSTLTKDKQKQYLEEFTVQYHKLFPEILNYKKSFDIKKINTELQKKLPVKNEDNQQTTTTLKI